MTKERKNTGITVEPIFFPSSSDIDESVDMNTQNTAEADVSSITFENEKIPKTMMHASDTSNIDFYAMKSKSINGQFKRPCKIEFQMVTPSMKQKTRRHASKCHFEHQACPCQNYLQSSNTHVPAMNSQMSNTNVKMQNDSHCINMPENFPKPKPEVGRLRKIMSCFTPNSGDKNACDNCEDGKDDKKDEKTDYYPFDHGDSNYFNTTDKLPQLISDNANEKVYQTATKFWAEFFGTINVGVTFFLVFFLQLYRFILYSFIRSTVVGFLQTTSDYAIKPILAVLFNGLIQPILLFLRNIFQSIWNTVEPLAQMLLGCFLPFIECLRSIRIVDINMNTTRNKERRNESIV